MRGTFADPETGKTGGEEGVTFAFEGGFARKVKDGVTVLLEPAAEVRLFALALGMEEAGKGDAAVVLDAGVGGEDHVGRAGLGCDEEDVGEWREGGMEVAPLGFGAGA